MFVLQFVIELFISFTGVMVCALAGKVNKKPRLSSPHLLGGYDDSALMGLVWRKWAPDIVMMCASRAE